MLLVRIARKFNDKSRTYLYETNYNRQNKGTFKISRRLHFFVILLTDKIIDVFVKD